MSQTNTLGLSKVEVNGDKYNIQTQPILYQQNRLANILSFCYGLSETDIRILFLISKNEMKKTEDLVRDLNISKAGVNRSLNKLLGTGLIVRIKEPGNRIGRPRYQYKVVKGLKDKILKDIRECANIMEKLIEQELGST